jgi:hypothetical protein
MRQVRPDAFVRGYTAKLFAPAPCLVHFKFTGIQPFHRLDDEMNQMVFRKPFLQVLRKQ